MRRSSVFIAVSLLLPSHSAFASDSPGTTTTVVPNSTVVTVVPNSTVVTVVPNSTTVTLAPGANLPPGATMVAPPGIGAAGTTPIIGDPSKSTAPVTTTSGKIEFTADQISSLPPDQRAAAEAALAKAQASAPAASSGQSAPNIPSSIAGLTPEMLSHLTPDQLMLVEQAKNTGTIPAELKGMLANIADVPGDVYAKLSPQQKTILDNARASGVLDKAMINDILDGLTPDEIKKFTSGQSISTSTIQKAAAKKTITCVSGKKTIKLVAANCPKGYKKA